MQAPIFAKIKPQTVDHIVVESLRSAIINGRLEPGARLPETDLAEQMAVSRIPIREALRQLEQEGLIKREPNRGCFVVEFTEQDVKEVFSMRVMLESMSFEWAIPNMRDEDFAELARIIDIQKEAIAAQDFDQLTEYDMRFHEYICLQANHSRLLKIWYEQHAQCQTLLNLRFRKLADHAPQTVISDHTAILRALEARDVAACVQLTQDISRRVSRECIETIFH